MLSAGGCGLSGEHLLAQSYGFSGSIEQYFHRSRNGHEITAAAVIFSGKESKAQRDMVTCQWSPSRPRLTPKPWRLQYVASKSPLKICKRPGFAL